MQFRDAAAIESLTWQMRLADYPRSLDRAKIDDVFNGQPPFSEQEVAENNIEVNVNFLESTSIGHAVRGQLNTAMLTPDPLFTVSVDYGPLYRRRDWGDCITKKINRAIKQSLKYFEGERSTYASLVLHGVGPVVWGDRETWCPRAIGIEDALIPSGTLLTMENLPFFAIFQQFTGYQLERCISGPNIDPGWNLPLAKECIKWVDQQASQLMANSWPEVWSPEKWAERQKENSGLYSSDSVPTVDAFDFYFWNDDGKNAGWERRIVLDAYGQPGVGGINYSSRPGRKFEFGSNQFLYDSSRRKRSKYADSREHIAHWQFADCSAVAPFRYHSVRSLGYLEFAVISLQNRLRCKFNESVFESLLQYFRVHNLDDVERAIKINLINRGIIPDGVEFVPIEQRWKVDQAIVEMCFEQNRRTITEQSSSYLQDLQVEQGQDRETATKTMAKVNASAALVAAMLQQAYTYQQFKYREICRRFCIPKSKDPDVRRVRLEILKAGVPEEAIDIDRWDVQATRVLGEGNKTLQQAIAQSLMVIRPQLDPTAQKKVDRMYISAFTGNYELANDLVPSQPHISDSRHDAQLTLGTLLQGIEVQARDGTNHVEVIEELLKGLATELAKVEQSGGMATAQQIQGFANVINHIGQHIGLLAQDPREKQAVKMYGDDLGQLSNLVEGYAQRLQEQMEKAAQNGQGGNGQGGLAPEDAAKIQATLIGAQAKADAKAQSHAQVTAQRQLSWENKMEQQAAEHKAKLAQQAAKDALELQKQATTNLLQAQRPTAGESK